jgi:arylsulfatase A-like enzyme
MTSSARGAARRPNVLIIMTDDQRAGTIKYMPRTRRWFKRAGTSFINAYSTTPLCCPSRTSIFTGRYAHNHGVKNNHLTDELEQKSTLQRYLKEAGYRTALFGKYLNSWAVTWDPPYFDAWATWSRGGGHYYNNQWNVRGRVKTIKKYSTDFIKRRAVRFLERAERDDRRPWLLYLTPVAPHRPFTPEPDYARARVPVWKSNPAVSERDKRDKPPYVQQKRVRLKRVEQIRRQQLRTLMSVDELVGRVFGLLKRQNEKRRTVAFFLSDNGYLWGEHGLALNTGKRPPYVPSVRIPMVVRWPGRVGASKTTRRLVANIDVAPTVLDAANVEPSSRWPLDGRSLLGGGARRRLLLEYWVDVGRTPEWAATQTAAYQYIEYYEEDGTTVAFREYYDLAGDRWELRNLLADRGDGNDPDVDELSERLDEDRGCEGSDCP